MTVKTEVEGDWVLLDQDEYQELLARVRELEAQCARADTIIRQLGEYAKYIGGDVDIKEIVEKYVRDQEASGAP